MAKEETPVRAIMRTDLVTVTPEDHLGTALARMADRDVHRLPVVQEQSGDVLLVGIISDRDLRLAADSPFTGHDPEQIAESLRHLSVGSVMTSDPELQVVFPSTPVSEAARIMIEGSLGGLPVVEQEHGRRFLVGLVTRTDLLLHLIELETASAAGA